ncbi:hypothetical protein [Sphingorhabdus sp.]|uniref:hypothetical protein n=1 Tax=Sphingorhabdus sp. TaxID=1902408 RepID=UPI0035947B32
MKKPIIAALLLSTAVPAFACPEEVGNEEVAPASADSASDSAVPAGKEAFNDVISLFSKMFDTSDQLEPDPARLELAKVTAAKLLPDGTYSRMMNDMFGKMLTPIPDIIPGLTDEEIANTTGASEEAVAALSEEQKAAVTQIIDPNHKERGKQVIDIIKSIISEAVTAIQPAMRTGLSRAVARKFTAPQLTTVNGFFDTPTGSAFALEIYALQVDPEVMQAAFKALPAMLTSFGRGDEAAFEAKFEDLPTQRELKDLSEAEMQQLAGLLSVEVKALEDHRAIATTVDPYAEETGEEPWYAEGAWAETERKKVKALEAKVKALNAQYYAAYVKAEAVNELLSTAYDVHEAAIQAAIDATRKRMLADGWTPPPAPSETSDTTEDSTSAEVAA